MNKNKINKYLIIMSIFTLFVGLKVKAMNVPSIPSTPSTHQRAQEVHKNKPEVVKETFKPLILELKKLKTFAPNKIDEAIEDRELFSYRRKFFREMDYINIPQSEIIAKAVFDDKQPNANEVKELMEKVYAVFNSNELEYDLAWKLNSIIYALLHLYKSLPGHDAAFANNFEKKFRESLKAEKFDRARKEEGEHESSMAIVEAGKHK